MKIPKIQYVLLLCSLIICVISCQNEEIISPIPEIKFLGMSKDTMVQSFFNDDTLQIALSFVDGDGDIGNVQNSAIATIFIVDLRTGELYDRFAIPAIPSNDKALKGEMYIRLFTTCCVFPDNIPPCEVSADHPTNELELEISLLDRARHRSNIIKTPIITLLCN